MYTMQVAGTGIDLQRKFIFEKCLETTNSTLIS